MVSKADAAQLRQVIERLAFAERAENPDLRNNLIRDSRMALKLLVRRSIDWRETMPDPRFRNKRASGRGRGGGPVT